MYNKTRLFFLSLTVVMVLIFGAVGPTPVYADDGTTSGQPTDETASATDPQPNSSVVSAESAAANEDVAPAEPAAASEPAAPEEPATTNEDVAPAESAAASEPTAPAEPAATNEPDVANESAAAAEPVAATSEPDVASEVAAPAEDPTGPSEAVIDPTLLEQVPDNTAIVVVNSVGETQPLAAQATAEAIALSDPIWCPAGQGPTPGDNGCSSSFSSFDALLTHIQANEATAGYQQAGTIYVQIGAYNGGEASIDFNSYGFTTFNAYNLNIQGGWDTSGGTINPAVGTSFNAPMMIGTSVNPWAGSLSFNNLQFGNISNNTALTAYSQNNVTLSDIEITNTHNGNAATLGSTNGDVTISGGLFNNSNIGAEINAGGNVTFQNNAKFENNKKAGAVITAGGNVDISNATFDNNGSIVNKIVDGRGLQIENGGLVTLSNIQANGNKLFGANINTVGNVSINNSFFSGNQSYVSSCSTSSHYGYGLQVVSLGDISLDGVSASDNNLLGAHLEGGIYVTVANSTFNNNGFTSGSKVDGRGLEAKSNGVVILNNVQANHNSLFGANIDTVGVALIYNSTFTGNQAYTCACGGYTAHGYGLRVVVLYGSILLDGVVADDNYLSGAYLESGGSVDVYNSSFNGNVFDKSNKVQVGSGLEIKNGGSVTLTNVQANDNSLFGANIVAGGNVMVSNSIFSGNYLYTCTCNCSSLNGYGLKIVSGGNTTLNQVTAEDNNLFGADLETGGNVTVSDSSFSNNGFNNSSKVAGYGLEVDSLGGVTLSGVQANGNKLFGTDIDATGDVEIYNSIFSGNQAYTCSYCGGYTVYGYGLQAVTDGGLTIDDITAEDNYLYGAHLEAEGGIVVSNSSFNGNKFSKSNKVTGYGLEIVGSGGVSLSGVQANNNNLFGASLSGAAVTVVNSAFSNNSSGSNNNPTGQGLVVNSDGSVNLSGVEANYNQLFGANIKAGDIVSVSNSFFNGNIVYTCGCGGIKYSGYGLQVVTPADITLDHVTASYNGSTGAILNTDSDAVVSNSTFDHNKGTGLSVTTPGHVTLANVVATNNGIDGVDIFGSCTTTVDVIDGTFSNNGKYGIKAVSATVTLSGSPILANNPAGDLFIDNSACGGSGGGGCGGGSGHGEGHHGHHHHHHHHHH